MKNKDNVDKTEEKFDPKQMKIVTVTPIDRGLIKEELSYFTKNDIPRGTLVQAPIRNRLVPCLVLRTEPASNTKSLLRGQSFSLKKLPPGNNELFFLEDFVQTSIEMANFFACHPGQIIKIFTPKIILENPTNLGQKLKKKKIDQPHQTKSDRCILQEPDQERLTYYKSLIRESFAKKQSVFFCLPTIPDIEKMVPFLEKGIERYILILHGSLTKKEILERWKKAIKSSHSIVVIATPLFLSLPRSDIKTLVVDKENSTAYHTQTKPFIDIRIFAEHYASLRNIKIIFGDTVLRSETIFRQGKGELIPSSPLKYRSFSEAEQILIDLRQKSDEPKKELPLISSELKDIVSHNISHNERLFIFSDKRGTSSLTVCNDCGHIMGCEKCSSPLVIHKNQNKKYQFTCHKCGESFPIRDTCDKCNSWRLSMLGSGIEKMEEEINTAFPEAEVFSIDSDKIKTSKKAKNLIEKFLASPGSILIGTEMALYYLNEPIENTAIGSIDSLFSLPDFRINEKIFATLIRTRELASNKFIIQTRNPEERMFDYCLKGNLLDFYREEIDDRKTYNYPPFSTLIKITLDNEKEKAEVEMDKLSVLLKDYQPSIYPSLNKPPSNKYRLCCLIKLSPDNWPNEKLSNILKTLPPSFVISIDPEEIL